MNNNQLKRYKKVSTDNFYLLDYNSCGDKYNFDISGSTSNLYTVTVNKKDKNIYCTCPDAFGHARKQGVICKHCCFILFKVVKCFRRDKGTVLVNINNKLYPTDFFHNLRFSKYELDHIESKYKKININECSNEDLLEKYKKKHTYHKKNDFTKSNRVIEEDDDCPICFDILSSDKSKLVSCPKCRNYIHTHCMKKWLKKRTTCVYCRHDVWKNYGKEKKDSYNKYIKLDDI